MEQQLIPNSISPFVGEQFLFELLSGNVGVAALVGNRIAPARDGFEPAELLTDGQQPGEAWPYVLFGESEDAQLDTYSSDLVLQREFILIRAFTREDLSAGFEDVAAHVYLALLGAVQGGFGSDVSGEWGGTVHECQLLPGRHRAIYGERGRRVCEMGVNVRLTTT